MPLDIPFTHAAHAAVGRGLCTTDRLEVIWSLAHSLHAPVHRDMYLGREFEEMCAQMYYRGKMFGELLILVPSRTLRGSGSAACWPSSQRLTRNTDDQTCKRACSTCCLLQTSADARSADMYKL